MDPIKKEEQTANERRRYEALHIIAELQRRKRQNRTNEMLLDQEALRQAAIRAGLEDAEQ
jgi:predicted transcriptional regulator